LPELFSPTKMLIFEVGLRYLKGLPSASV
jgi:hypothetical protein